MSPDSAATPVPATGGATFTVTPDLEKRFPEIIALIRGSESMNDEERQYWASILPAMTPEQIQNLTQILENEKHQLAEIDAKYAAAVEQVGQVRDLKVVEGEHRQRNTARESAEKTAEASEEQTAEDLLKQIEGDAPKKAP